MKTLCQSCGKPIPAARLKALPDTLTCVKCSEVHRLTEDDVDIDGSSGQDMNSMVSGNERTVPALASETTACCVLSFLAPR
jgi:hypothetical protein